MNGKSLVPVLLVLVGLGVGFGSGYFYRGRIAARARGNFAFGDGNGSFQRFVANGTGMMGGGGMMRGGGIVGSILSMDDKSFTVKLADGSSKIVLFTGSTTYSNTQTASKGDIKTGNQVAVFGASNSDGSVTATNVQINPMFRFNQSPTPAAQ